jgi:uncharacterized delta-60 repeat protein
MTKLLLLLARLAGYSQLHTSAARGWLLRQAFLVLIVLVAMPRRGNAQTGALDTSFGQHQTSGLDLLGGVNNAVLAIDFPSSGQMLFGGSFSHYNSTLRRGFARLNQDSSLDAQFSGGNGVNGSVTSLVYQLDGKVLLAGQFSNFNGSAYNNIVRLNLDSSLDTSFGIGTGTDGSINALLLQPDGRILIGGTFTTYNGAGCGNLARLNADGTLDLSFNSLSGANFGVQALQLQPDGRVLVGGSFTTFNGVSRNGIARLNVNGTLDLTFQVGSGVVGTVHALTLQPDGKVIVSGQFTSVNGLSRNGIARMNADGSVDASFNPGTGTNDTIYALKLQPDGKVLIGGTFTAYNSIPRNRLARLSADGSLDPSFNAGTGPNGPVRAIALQPDGKIVAGGMFTQVNGVNRSNIARLNARGVLVPTFNEVIGANGPVHAIVRQPNGRVVISGQFTHYDGLPCNRIARLEADGRLDATFNSGAGADNHVMAIQLQLDGKLLIGGWFTSYNGTPCNRLARLNTDGTIDTSFQVGAGPSHPVNVLALQSDGRILVGGQFTTFNGVPQYNIARLHSDGSLDTTFNSGTGADAPVLAIGLEANGKVLIGGLFTSYNGTTRNRIARLNPDGSLDSGFAPGTGADSVVQTLVVQPDGKVLFGGGFANYNGTPRRCIARVNSDGSLDGGFNPGQGAIGSIRSLIRQSDGRVIIAGIFTSYNGTLSSNIARVNANGSVDFTYNVGAGLDGVAHTLVLQPDGRVLVGGGFTRYNGIASIGVARIHGDSCAADSDLDGTPNCSDGCPTDPLKSTPGICGCFVPDTDTDGDLVPDCQDNCDAIPNPTQGDCDTDTIGDVCEIAAGAPDINNNQVPDSCDAVGGVPFCLGLTGCPCGNNHDPTFHPIAGCYNGVPYPWGQPVEGASLLGSGIPMVSNDSLVLSANTIGAISLLFQGDATTNMTFRDGKLCVTGNVVRIVQRQTSLGGWSYPNLGEPPISVRGVVPVSGGVRNYQAWYRDLFGPCGTGSNLTNAVAVIWVP